MQKRWICVVLALLLCCSLVLPVSAEETAENTVKEKAVEIKNKTVTDSLPDKDAERWYRFTIENTADAIVRFTADFAETGDYWHISVYKVREGKSDDLQKDTGVGGGTAGQNDVMLPNRTPGTYYVRVQSRTAGSAGSPEKYFTDTPFTLEVITEGYTYPTGTAQRKTVSKAGEIIAVIGGKLYIKRNDGQAYIGCCVVEESEEKIVSGPILLAEDRAAVEYYTPYITDSMWNLQTLELNGKTYYYTYIRDGYKGVAYDETLYKCCKGETVTEEEAAGDLLKLHTGVSPVEKAQKKENKQNIWGWIIGAVLGLGSICGMIIFLKFCFTDKVYVDPEKFTGVGSRTYTEEEKKTVGEMQTIQRINSEISSPDYDPTDFPKGPSD